MNITYAGKPLVIDGVEYELSPITLEDLEYLDDWIRSRTMRAARLSLGEDASPEQHRETMRAAAEAANETSLFSGQGVQQLMTPLGASRLLMRLLKRNATPPTTAQCFSWLSRPDLQDDLRIKLLDVFKRAKDGEVDGSNPRPTVGSESSSIRAPSSGG